MGKAVSVFTHSIDSQCVGQVFDGPGAEQSLPVESAAGWPIGNDDVQIGVERSLPERVGEAQIEADEKADADAVDGEREGSSSSGVVFVLTRE